MDNRYPKSSDIKDQKIKVEKREQKTNDRNEKIDNRADKVDRPVKWNKNKHSFVVAGKIIFLHFFSLKPNLFLLTNKLFLYQKLYYK